MGLVYDPGESGALRAVLAGNLSAASTALDAVDKASAHLVEGLGSGNLSGKGYAAIESLFSQLIAPSVKGARDQISSIQKDLERYTHEDSKVSGLGLLKEDELKKQLTATKNQRDATELQIERNRRNAVAATAIPTVSEGLELANRQLELVLTQLDHDILDLEARIRALQGFSSATLGLFGSSLDDLGSRISDVITLLDSLNEPIKGVDVLGGGATALGAMTERKKILDFLGGKKITVDAKGRVKAGKTPLYNKDSGRLYVNGQKYNAATGTRIDYYQKYVKAGLKGAGDGLVGDFTGWKGAWASDWNVGKIAKYGGKAMGIAGVGLTVANNANTYFGDGVNDEYDVPDFAVDTGVDLAAIAASAGAGAVAGSFILPPAGTIVGAIAGGVVGWALDFDWFGQRSATDVTKDAIKEFYHAKK